MRDEDAIRARIGQLAEAIRNKACDDIRRVYAEQIVSFDVEPPLQHAGLAAKLANREGLFAHVSSLDYEVRDLDIVVGGDIAFARSFNQIRGTRDDGTQTAHWIRCTNCFRKISGEWRIVHDHVSVPFDMAAGKAFVDLSPP